MATALFSRNGKGRRVVREEAETVEAQLAQLRDDIASLAKIVSRDASSGVETVKGRVRGVRGKAARIQGDAESHMHDLIAAGEEGPVRSRRALSPVRPGSPPHGSRTSGRDDRHRPGSRFRPRGPAAPLTNRLEQQAEMIG